MRRRPVKHCHSAVVSARRVCCDDAILSRHAGVDSVCYICLLEDAQVHVGLGHPPQRRLQSPVTTVTDVVGAKPNPHFPPHKTPSTLTHPLPSDAFLTLAPNAIPVCACLYFCRSRPCSAPCRPSLAVPISVPVPGLPPFLLRAVHLGMRYSIVP